MIGVLIASHGGLSAGMIDSLHMFFGDNLPQVDSISLKLESSAEQFGAEMDRKLAQLDTGEGVVIFADMFGGTPCNQALLRANEKIRVVCGTNLPMVMDFLSARSNEVNLDAMIEVWRNSIFDAMKYISNTSNTEQNDSFD